MTVLWFQLKISFLAALQGQIAPTADREDPSSNTADVQDHTTKLQHSLAAAAAEKAQEKLAKVIRNREVGLRVEPRVQPPRQVAHEIEYYHIDSEGDVSSDNDSVASIEYQDLLAMTWGLSSYTDTEHPSGVEEEEYQEKTKKKKETHYSAKG